MVHHSMRPHALLLLLLILPGLLHAQERDKKLWAHILGDPDRSTVDPMQDMSYYAGSDKGGDANKSANVKEFYFTNVFSPKSFTTKEYAASGYWQGDFKFATKAAPVKTSSAVGKIFATKPAPVKDATESGKGYDTKTYGTREAVERGKTSQAHLDELYKGQTEMNMDQVRDLLNRSH